MGMSAEGLESMICPEMIEPLPAAERGFQAVRGCPLADPVVGIALGKMSEGQLMEQFFSV